MGKNGLTIRPFKHLCKHIGWSIQSIHGKESDKFPTVFKKNISFPLIHPTKIQINHYHNGFEDSNVRKVKFINYFYYKIKNNSFIKY